jgi:F0F1-type ATP synthase beta subunit
VQLKDPIKAFKMIVTGECDSLAEMDFFMLGGFADAIA